MSQNLVREENNEMAQMKPSAFVLESNGVQWSGSELVHRELDAMSSIGFIPPQAYFL